MRTSILILAILTLAIQTKAQDSVRVNKFIDDWHLSAAAANGEVFFGSIAENGIYIGTADFERWTKPEFMAFAKPYFDRGKAWDFKPYDRNLYFSGDGRYAWFSELLKTWMGVCRGSGVLVHTPGGWKIAQYHLSVTVPNEIIGDFIKLVDGFQQQKKK